MSVLPIRVLGDPILRRRAATIGTVRDDLRRLADNMYETMYAAKGIGLAAPQVGVSERLFITDVDGARYVMIDPELVSVVAATDVSEEGCLSIPEVLGDVRRPSSIVMRAIDLKGEPITIDASGMLARCMQHELDHLEGRLFIDHLSFLKRRHALADWAKLEKDFPGHIRMLTPGDPGDPDRGRPTEEL